MIHHGDAEDAEDTEKIPCHHEAHEGHEEFVPLILSNFVLFAISFEKLRCWVEEALTLPSPAKRARVRQILRSENPLAQSAGRGLG